MATIQKIIPNLWYDTQAEEAVKFYTSVFKNSSIIATTYFGKAGHEVHGMKEGMVMTIAFELEGQRFLALNGGPAFKFNEAVSFIVTCNTQEEIDYFWEKLSEGGDERAQQCGWLKDRFGLSWQVVPEGIDRYFAGSDRQASERAMNALLGMKKLDMRALEEAFSG